MPAMPRHLLWIWGLLVLVGLACSAPLALAPTAQPTATQAATATHTPTATPTATSTPTLSSGDRLDAGHQALFNGDWESALAHFERVIAESDDPELVGEARYGRGQALYRSGRVAEADEFFWQFISDYTPTGHPRLADARWMRGQIRLEIGDPSLAIEDFSVYLQLSPNVIDSYAEEWLADAHLTLGQPEQAIQHYQRAVSAGRATSKLPVMVKLGRALLRAGDAEAAIAQFDQVAALTEDHGTKASMNLLAAEAYESQGDLDSMYARLLDSVSNYPTAHDSYIGLVRLVEAGVPVDEFQRGLVDYYAAAYQPAIAAFDRIIAAGPTAEAYYYRGLSYLAQGNSLAALADFDFVVSSYPDHPLWSEAMFDKALTEWAYLDRYSLAVDTYLRLAEASADPGTAAEALARAARTAERSNDLVRAAQIWLDLADRYPGSAEAPEAAFLAGVTLYRTGDAPAARSAFESVLQLSTAGVRQRSAAQLWIGKTHAAQGAAEQAGAAWAQAAQIDPTGYYSERAAELLAGGEPFARTRSFDFTTDLAAERQQAEDWLRATFGITAAGPLSDLGQALAADPRLIRAEELWQLGRWEEARAEFQVLRAALAGDAEATYRLMHRLLELGLYREAIFASRQILNLAGMDDAATLQAPVYFNRVRFGAYFGELILPEAASYGLDGLFLLSVVRQESLFEGFALSSAAAHGLMQVIPSTGASIAEQLGWPPNYQQSDLYRPIVSVRFGTYYLAAQRDRFDGDLYAALAAYNAGPGNSILWKELAPDDPDLFLEVVRLDQPQIYIQVIYEVFQIYRSLYASG